MINELTLIGNLGREVEAKTTATGMQMAIANVATADGFGDKQTTEWFRVVFFGKQAENLINFTSKGTQLYIKAKLKNNSYTTEQGETKKSIQIIGREFRILSKGRAENSQQNAPQSSTPTIEDFADLDSQPPF